MAQPEPSVPPASRTSPRLHVADYNSELRRPDGRVDTEAMVRRLTELGVTTYYWLVWHAPTDWDDLTLFLPQARKAGIGVWAYLVPPSESPPQYGGPYSKPFRLDYPRWAEEIARLSLEHTNLTAWVSMISMPTTSGSRPPLCAPCRREPNASIRIWPSCP